MNIPPLHGLKYLDLQKYPNIYDDIDRFIDKLENRGKCWIYTASKRPGGYGQFKILRFSIFATIAAHRFSYEIFFQDFDDDLCVSHTCGNPACVNPAHLIQMTQKEIIHGSSCPAGVNYRRTHCKNGHELTPENTLIRNKKRRCKKCTRAYQKAYRIKNKKRNQSNEQPKKSIN